MVVAGLKVSVLSVGLLMALEWLMRKRSHGLDVAHLHPVVRCVIYYALLLVVLEFGADSESFIYFQF